MAPAAARRAAAAAIRYGAATTTSSGTAPSSRAARIHHAPSSRASRSGAAAIHPAPSSLPAGSPAVPRRAATSSSGAASTPRATTTYPAPSSRGSTPRPGDASTPRAADLHAAPSSLLAGSASVARRAATSLFGASAPAAPSSLTARSAAAAPSSLAAARSSGISATAGDLGTAARLSRATARFGLHSGRLTRANPFQFKVQRRFKHTQKKIPEEVLSELQRIDSDGIKRHKELQQAILELTKKVADGSAQHKANKVDATWGMGKIAFKVCFSVLTCAGVFGYGVLKLVKFGGGKESKEAAVAMVDRKTAELKRELEDRMDTVIQTKDNEEATSLSLKKVILDEKSLLLDKKQSELEAREAAVAAKEAAAKKP